MMARLWNSNNCQCVGVGMGDDGVCLMRQKHHYLLDGSCNMFSCGGGGDEVLLKSTCHWWNNGKIVAGSIMAGCFPMHLWLLIKSSWGCLIGGCLLFHPQNQLLLVSS